MQALSSLAQRVPQSAPADKERSKEGIQRPQNRRFWCANESRSDSSTPSSPVLVRSGGCLTGPRKLLYRRTPTQNVRWALRPVDLDLLAVPRRTARSVRKASSHGQRSNATQSVRYPTGLPHRDSKSGSLRRNACGNCTPCGNYGCSCKARSPDNVWWAVRRSLTSRGSRRPHPQRAWRGASRVG